MISRPSMLWWARGGVRARAIVISRLIVLALLSVTLELSMAIASEAARGGDELEEWVHRPCERRLRLVPVRRPVTHPTTARRVDAIVAAGRPPCTRNVSIRPVVSPPQARRAPPSLAELPSSIEEH